MSILLQERVSQLAEIVKGWSLPALEERIRALEEEVADLKNKYKMQNARAARAKTNE